jgi:hypothetical protein
VASQNNLFKSEPIRKKNGLFVLLFPTKIPHLAKKLRPKISQKDVLSLPKSNLLEGAVNV